MIKKSKKSPTRRADGGKQIKTDAIFQRVRQFMYDSVTWDKSKIKQKPPAEERAEGKGIDCENKK